MMETFIGPKEKWTYEGDDKQEVADSLLHNASKKYAKTRN